MDMLLCFAEGPVGQVRGGRARGGRAREGQGKRRRGWGGEEDGRGRGIEELELR